jgi:UDP-N-acetylmuramoyl-L-alanyl-D-glutamate--2,6-diaminopimelate ligase
MKTFFDICAFLSVQTNISKNFNLQGLTIDSRTVQPNDIFCACVGAQHDGHDYVAAAIQQGAALILTEKALTITSSVPVIIIPKLTQRLSALAAWFYDTPARKLKIIGVTGTNGKTSTTHYLAQFLHLLGHKTAVIGTLGNGVWGQLHESIFTTPEPVGLQRQLADFVADGIEYVCMEVSSHALALKRVQDLNFVSAVFTNLTQDHLDFHGTMENYAQTKAQFFAWPQLKTIILNRDDPYYVTMLQQATLQSKVYFYSLSDSDEMFVYADGLTLATQGLSFTLHSPWGQALIKTQLLGNFNVSNLLAAFTTLLSLDFSLAQLAPLSSLIQPVRGRMEVLRYPHLPLVVIDYAHTPDALEKALTALKSYHCPLWVVFGCGGNRDPGKRPLMAAIAEQFAEQIIVSEDNSRFEDPEKIFADIFKGFKNPQAVQLIPMRAAAITYALTHAPKNAIILLAGKGHETYLERLGQKEPFDERVVLKNFVATSS